MPDYRLSRKLFVQRWNAKPVKVIKLLLSSLGIDKAEWLEDIQKGSCPLKSFFGHSRGK